MEGGLHVASSEGVQLHDGDVQVKQGGVHVHGNEGIKGALSIHAMNFFEA